jgi:hypothetical protein
MRPCAISIPIPFLLFHLKLLAKTFVFNTTFFYCFFFRPNFFVKCTTKNRNSQQSLWRVFLFSFPPAVLLCCAWASPRPTYTSLIQYGSLVYYFHYGTSYPSSTNQSRHRRLLGL